MASICWIGAKGVAWKSSVWRRWRWVILPTSLMGVPQAILAQMWYPVQPRNPSSGWSSQQPIKDPEWKLLSPHWQEFYVHAPLWLHHVESTLIKQVVMLTYLFWSTDKPCHCMVEVWISSLSLYVLYRLLCRLLTDLFLKQSSYIILFPKLPL